jgi:endoglucanase
MKILKFFLIIVIFMPLITCQTQGTRPQDDNTFTRDPRLDSLIRYLPDAPNMIFVRNMGLGVNIGNTLDAIGTNTWHAGETGWGNPPITREFIQALKRHGYKTIRLPVTWAEYMGPAPDFRIGTCVFNNCNRCPHRMDRVEEVVNWILEEGMYCILNIHHDGGHSDKSWILRASTDRHGTADQFAKVWRQIAERFSGASEKLILESLNEVGFDDLWTRWGGGSGTKAQAYEIFNMLNQVFVDTVRGTPGHEDRYLLIAGYWTDVDLSVDPLFKMPQDTVEDKLLLSIHYYTPSTFCIAEEPNNSWGFRSTWGTAADYQELNRQFQKLVDTFVSKGIPVILGEYGVTKKNKDEESRIKWMTAVTQISLNTSMNPVLWDTGINPDRNNHSGEFERNYPYGITDTLKTVLSFLEFHN